MTRLIADSDHFGHGQILLARVCAGRLDATIAAEEFVRMVARLVDFAVAEAIEDLGPVPHVRVESKDRVPQRVADGFGESRSTGAAGAGSSADHQAQRAASEAPAAPSISTLPAADRVYAAPSAEGAESATGGVGRRRVTDADRAAIKADYLAALGTRKKVPWGTYERLAEKHGLSKFTIKNVVAAMHLDVKAKQSEPEIPLSETDVDPIEDDVDTPHVEPETRVHTNTPQCWCRKRHASRDNPWCKLPFREKPATESAALRTPAPRVTRMQGTRY